MRVFASLERTKTLSIEVTLDLKAKILSDLDQETTMIMCISLVGFLSFSSDAIFMGDVFCESVSVAWFTVRQCIPAFVLQTVALIERIALCTWWVTNQCNLFRMKTKPKESTSK